MRFKKDVFPTRGRPVKIHFIGSISTVPFFSDSFRNSFKAPYIGIKIAISSINNITHISHVIHTKPEAYMHVSSMVAHHCSTIALEGYRLVNLGIQKILTCIPLMKSHLSSNNKYTMGLLKM